MELLRRKMTSTGLSTNELLSVKKITIKVCSVKTLGQMTKKTPTCTLNIPLKILSSNVKLLFPISIVSCVLFYV